MSDNKDFVIENGVLKKYVGSGGDVVIPEGVTAIGELAFRDCKDVVTVHMPNSVTTINRSAFIMCSNLKSVTLSNNLVTIGNSAFSYCKNLSDISIPKSVTSINTSAFDSCENLKNIAIPCGVTTINPDTFKRCTSLSEIELTDNITVIESGAFQSCKALNSFCVPSEVTRIGDMAFAGCTNLKSLKLSEKLNNFGSDAFEMCNNLEIELPESLAINLETLSPMCRDYYICKYKIKTSDRGYAALTINQRGAIWQKWRAARSSENPSGEFDHMLDMLSKQKPFNTKAGKAVAEFILKYYKELSVEDINKMLALFKGKKCKEISELSDFRNLMEYLGEATSEADPMEFESMKLVEKFTLREDIAASVKKGIHWKNSNTFCPREVLICIISYYADEWNRCKSVEYGGFSSVEVLRYGSDVKINSDIDTLAEMLDKEELSSVLTAMIKGVKYRLFILAWARFANDKDVEEMTSQFKKLSRGKAKERYLASNLEQALLINKTRSAMLFYDSIEKLDMYAAYYGITAMEIRDIHMLLDFGFDSKGIKSYDIGGNTIEISLTYDLKFKIFDTEKQKEIRSIPKKSDDPAKAELAAKSFVELKKEVGKFIKLRSEQLCKMHLSGDCVSEELWRKVYLENPIIKHLSEHIIWTDESGVTFTVIDGKTVNYENEECTPNGKIYIAHVLDMKPEEINRWQQFLLAENQTQLFEQIWEPVCQWNESEINTRYKGITISVKERNILKSNLKKRGINVHSGEMDREFDANQWKYEFIDKNTMYIGKSMEIDYTVLSDDNISFDSAKLIAHANKKEINAIIFELDKIAVTSYIKNNQSEYLTELLLSNFSVSQIVDFIDVANASDATNCISYLMNYKNEHYPEFEAMENFVLEW